MAPPYEQAMVGCQSVHLFFSLFPFTSALLLPLITPLIWLSMCIIVSLPHLMFLLFKASDIAYSIIQLCFLFII